MFTCRIHPRVIERILRALLPGYLTRCIGTGVVVLVMLSVVAACATPTSPPIHITTQDTATATSPQVVATAYAAILVGELMEVNGCLQVKSSLDGTVYTLAWPPDTEVTITGNEVTVTTGIVRGQPETITLHFGDNARLSGGETMELSEQLQTSVSEGCPGPYWVVGFEISQDQATAEP